MADLPDFDDEPTVIQVRPDDLANEPPPLPFPLARSRSASDEDWLAELPEEAQSVLRAAAGLAGSWPRAPRIDGAVAEPLTPIPSLELRRHA